VRSKTCEFLRRARAARHTARSLSRDWRLRSYRTETFPFPKMNWMRQGPRRHDSGDLRALSQCPISSVAVSWRERLALARFTSAPLRKTVRDIRLPAGILPCISE